MRDHSTRLAAPFVLNVRPFGTVYDHDCLYLTLPLYNPTAVLYPDSANRFDTPCSQQQGHTLLARHSGADAALLHSLLTQHSASSSSSSSAPSAPLASSDAAPAAAPSAPAAAAGNKPRTDEEITARCHEIMNRHKVVLFMKGNPSSPKCGFSRQIVGLLREKGVEFAWFDIFSDEEVRQKLKVLNDWPSRSFQQT